MIPEFGHIILIVHLILSLLGGTLPLLVVYANYRSLEISIKKLSVTLFILITISFLSLIYSFLVDDFSVAYVAQNSNINLPENIKSGTEIKSPIIGTAYHAPEPGAKKFVEVGKKIKKGDTIMIVEAMKTMNHVPSTLDGVVKEVCVEDGQPVEFGQTLLILD